MAMFAEEAAAELGSTAATFRRPEAPLVVLFVSHSDDASAASVGAFVAAASASMESTAAPPVFHAITPSQPCDDDALSAEGLSFLALADLSGGVTADLCSVDYRPYLSVVGQLASDEGLGRRFLLSQQVNESLPVRVVVELADGYAYDVNPGDFEIFDAGTSLWLRSPPVAGATIIIEYDRAP